MKRVILDCDPGMDDSMAIVLAAKSPAIDLVAVTTSHGNVTVDLATTNARKTLEMLGRTDIPVARGMSRPMVRINPTDPFSHGDDGQANNHLPAPTMAVADEHAVALIVRLVNDNPGEIHLVCTGPLTNLAMAMVQSPEIIGKIASVTAISGAFGQTRYAFTKATGDTPQSEWNVYVDPEAAEIVYGSGAPFTAIGLDVATFAEDFTTEQLDALASSPRPEGRFLNQAAGFVTGRGYGAYCTVIDCLAVAHLIDPGIVETFRGRVGIETQGRLTFGMTVLDSRDHHAWTQLPEISIARSADHRRFLDLLAATVLS